MSRTGPDVPVANLSVGRVIEVDGSHIVAELDPTVSDLSRVYAGETYAIGQFGSIVRVHYGRKILYALVSRLRMKAEYQAERGVVSLGTDDERIIEADLFGEGEWSVEEVDGAPVWNLGFERGIATFPLPQQSLYLTPKSELRAIYGSHGDAPVIQLGNHVGAGNPPCFADMNELLGKHTAILGSTGTGKSATVASVVHSIMERKSLASHSSWNPRVVILDPHNEYESAFSASSRLSTSDGSLQLPYWLLNLQETLDLVVGKAEFVATSQANILKNALLTAREEGATALSLDATKITVDSPVPYSAVRLRELIDQSRQTNIPSKQESHLSILAKFDLLVRDTRMTFMMSEWTPADGDSFPAVMGALVGGTEEVRIIDLSGVPNEVAGVCSAVVARSLFNLKVWQSTAERKNTPVLLICEEAHRYVPDRGEAQYEAAKEAIRRVAKEGRKYGLGLMIVSQRPSEVEATVLSQCNSWIIMRITNDADMQHVRAVLPDSMAGLVKTLSSLRKREAIFLGQAAALPSRIRIRELQESQLPRSHDIDFDKGWQQPAITSAALGILANTWRYQGL
jgi:DNA helicase HerA-like ATPase